VIDRGLPNTGKSARRGKAMPPTPPHEALVHQDEIQPLEQPLPPHWLGAAAGKQLEHTRFTQCFLPIRAVRDPVKLQA
jgi:hypothetical protein